MQQAIYNNLSISDSSRTASVATTAGATHGQGWGGGSRAGGTW